MYRWSEFLNDLGKVVIGVTVAGLLLTGIMKFIQLVY